MTTKEIKILINDHFKVDIQDENRHRKFKIPRFIYYHLAREYAIDNKMITIAEEIDRDHSTVLYGIKRLQNIFKEYPSYQFSFNHLEEIIIDRIKRQDEAKEIEIVFDDSNLRPCIQSIVNDLKGIDDSDILNFTETRLKPYLLMLKSRRLHNIKHVAGALLR